MTHHRVLLVLVTLLGFLPGRSPGQAVDQPAAPEPVLTPDVRQNGPPANRPPDDPGQAPADNLFYVPGEYVPDRAGVSWREGYWAEVQPGWTWIPARWVRLSDGWSFHEGSWIAARNAVPGGQAQGQARNLQGAIDQVLDDPNVQYTVIREFSMPMGPVMPMSYSPFVSGWFGSYPVTWPGAYYGPTMMGMPGPWGYGSSPFMSVGGFGIGVGAGFWPWGW